MILIAYTFERRLRREWYLCIPCTCWRGQFWYCILSQFRNSWWQLLSSRKSLKGKLIFKENGTYFIYWNNFSLDLSHFVLSLHVVPELGLSENSVPCEDADSVESRVGILLWGKLSSNDIVLSDLQGRMSEGGRMKCTSCWTEWTPTPLTITI
jgi:hypothetical protein